MDVKTVNHGWLKRRIASDDCNLFLTKTKKFKVRKHVLF